MQSTTSSTSTPSAASTSPLIDTTPLSNPTTTWNSYNVPRIPNHPRPFNLNIHLSAVEKITALTNRLDQLTLQAGSEDNEEREALNRRIQILKEEIGQLVYARGFEALGNIR